MTTIRQRRLPSRGTSTGMTPANREAVARRPGAGAGGGPIRMALLEPVPGERTRLDGAWWPRSRSLGTELPALIAALHLRGVRVSRVTYHPDSWDTASRRLAADGRVIRLGWFRSLDPHLLNLTAGEGGRSRLDLLVVPPEATEAVAAGAMSAATARENHGTPTAVLDALRTVPDDDRPASPVAAPRVAADSREADEGVWDSEGGHARR
jgi:hypothetical protein